MDMKNQTTAWKLVRRAKRTKTIYYPLFRPALRGIKYQLNTLTTRVDRGGPFACFKDKHSVEIFLDKHSIKMENNIILLKCLITESKDTSLWRENANGRKVMGQGFLPAGTILADEVYPIGIEKNGIIQQKITIDDMIKVMA